MIKTFLVILFLYIVPVLVGNGVNRIWKMKSGVVRDFLLGNIFIWAFLQLITVPLVIAKQSFLVVIGLLTGAILLVSAAGIILGRNEWHPKVWWKNCLESAKVLLKNAEAIISQVLFIGILGYILYNVIALQHTDADDSRFVVNAVDILRTNRMFLTDPSTGLPVESWFGELIKDVTAPWAVYIAYCAKMTGISAVIMAHSVLPVSLILCAVAVYWLLAKHLIKRFANRCIFMFVVLLIQLYGCMSIYTAETFMLTRIWQGKAVVASVGIPAMLLIGMWLYRKEKEWRYYILLLALDMAMCLMSGMGIIIGAIMLGCMGLIYGIAKRKPWMSLALWGMCIPNVVYYVINSKII